MVGSGNGARGWRVQETAFAGVWRVQREDGRGGLAEDILEADDMPAVVKEAAARANGARLDAALPARGRHERARDRERAAPPRARRSGRAGPRTW